MADSTLPGMACHVFMNAVAFTVALAWNVATLAGMEHTVDIVIFAVSLPALLLSVLKLERTARTREPAHTAFD